jgi:hypothetical protein
MNTDIIFFVSRKYIRKKFLTTQLPKKFRKLSSSANIRKIKKLYLKNRFHFLISRNIDYIYSGKILFYLYADSNNQDLITTRGILFEQEKHMGSSNGVYDFEYINLHINVRYLFITYSSVFIESNISDFEVPIFCISKPDFDNKLLKRYFNTKLYQFKNLIYNVKTIQPIYL